MINKTNDEKIRNALNENKTLFLYYKGAYIGLITKEILKDKYISFLSDCICTNGILIKYDKVEVKDGGFII